ncbi:hypothetical protein R3P38DRAFT_2767061 [Favolaschia claudopus]|uniref:Uncharacterized protein n=1 Tax=Favolaschia claudopus TaxID=2862362 RepID=A0AAW0CU81_9AGAR
MTTGPDAQSLFLSTSTTPRARETMPPKRSLRPYKRPVRILASTQRRRVAAREPAPVPPEAWNPVIEARWQEFANELREVVQQQMETALEKPPLSTAEKEALAKTDAELKRDLELLEEDLAKTMEDAPLQQRHEWLENIRESEEWERKNGHWPAPETESQSSADY